MAPRTEALVALGILLVAGAAIAWTAAGITGDLLEETCALRLPSGLAPALRVHEAAPRAQGDGSIARTVTFTVEAASPERVLVRACNAKAVSFTRSPDGQVRLVYHVRATGAEPDDTAERVELRPEATAGEALWLAANLEMTARGPHARLPTVTIEVQVPAGVEARVASGREVGA